MRQVRVSLSFARGLAALAIAAGLCGGVMLSVLGPCLGPGAAQAPAAAAPAQGGPIKVGSTANENPQPWTVNCTSQAQTGELVCTMTQVLIAQDYAAAPGRRLGVPAAAERGGGDAASACRTASSCRTGSTSGSTMPRRPSRRS